VDWIDRDDFDSIDRAISNDTAALIFEPVQGVAGAIALSDEFVQALAQRCEKVGALLIADEVQSGVGRTGTLWAVEKLGVTPDILTAAKGLGNGFPVGAVMARAEIAQKLAIGQMGTTFGGGPMACAAIEGVLTVVDNAEFLSAVRRRSAILAVAVEQAGVTKITGRGYLLGFKSELPASQVRMELLDRGFLTGDAMDPNVVRLLPPLILSEAEIENFAVALKEVLN
jgi:acetylornithine/succinyldiaminopimelate/putrescine aminotransferase